MTKGVFDERDKKKVFVAFFAALLGLTAYIIKDFLNALIVGALIAYFLFPAYTKLERKVGSGRLAAGILSFASIIAIVIILALFLPPIISQTQALYHNSGKYVDKGIGLIEECAAGKESVSCTIAAAVSRATDTEDLQQESTDLVKKTSLFFTRSITSLVDSIVSFVLFTVIVLFSIFYFLDHGEKIKNTAVMLVPLTSSHKKKILERLRETIEAVVAGNISTALLQGVLGALIFSILGISSPLFWGLIMAILAFIPAVGPSVVWLPTAIFLFIQEQNIKAIVLIVYGCAIMMSVDAFLKPKLIGDRMKMSSFMVFLGVLGGLKVFGILGLFFGPIILALLATFIKIYQEEMVN